MQRLLWLKGMVANPKGPEVAVRNNISALSRPDRSPVNRPALPIA